MRLHDIVRELDVLVQEGVRLKEQWFRPMDPARVPLDVVIGAIEESVAAEREASAEIIRCSRPALVLLARPAGRPAPSGFKLLDQPDAFARSIAASGGELVETFGWSPSSSADAPADAGPDVEMTCLLVGGVEAPRTVDMIREAASILRAEENPQGQGLSHAFWSSGQSDLARLACFAVTLPHPYPGLPSLVTAQIGSFNELVGYPRRPMYEAPLRRRIGLRRLLEVDPNSPPLQAARQKEAEEGLRQIKGVPPVIRPSMRWVITAEIPAIEAAWQLCSELLKDRTLPADAIDAKTAGRLLGINPRALPYLADERIVRSWEPRERMRFSRNQIEGLRGTLLTLERAARLLDCDVKTIGNRIKEGAFPGFGPPRARVVRLADVEPFIGRGRQPRKSMKGK